MLKSFIAFLLLWTTVAAGQLAFKSLTRREKIDFLKLLGSSLVSALIGFIILFFIVVLF